MYFMSEEARLDSKAGVIPLLLWEKIFEHNIEDYELIFLDTEDLQNINGKTGVLSPYKEEDSLLLSEEENISINDRLRHSYAKWQWSGLKRCLCLFLAHPGASADDLIHTASLSLSFHIFNAALLANRPDIFDAASKIQDKYTLIRIGSPEVEYACELGYLEALKKASSIDSKVISTAIRFDGYETAAGAGHLEIIKWLHDEATTDELQAQLASQKEKALRSARWSKHTAVVEYISSAESATVQSKKMASTVCEDSSTSIPNGKASASTSREAFFSTQVQQTGNDDVGRKFQSPESP